MATILVTNDDGYKSAGYIPLIKTLSKNNSIIAIAPDQGRSWMGKAVTTKKIIKIKKITKEKKQIFTLDGTPADCVQIGLYHLAKNLPDLVVSGINIGPNIGNARILSSGTIGAAMESALNGVKSVASSLIIPTSIKNKIDFFSPKTYKIFEHAAEITEKIASIILENNFDEVNLLSINIPFNATINSDVEITKPFTAPYGQLFYKKRQGFIHHTPPIEFKNMKKKTDIKAVHEEKISITPLNLSLFSISSSKKVENIINKAW